MDDNHDKYGKHSIEYTLIVGFFNP